MAILTGADKKREFEHIMEFLNDLQIASNIIEAEDENGDQDCCLMVALPTGVEDWKEEYQTDIHLAVGTMIQLSDDKDQLTKYLMFYMAVQVDLQDADELAVLRLGNEWNRTMRVGSCIYGREKETGRTLLQVKCLIGACVDDDLDEGVVCETIYELGDLYDRLKEQLSALVSPKASGV